MPLPSDTQQARLADALRALSNPQRLMIMIWLTEPEQHFPPQREADLVEDGVCVGFITDKVGLSQPTVTTHLQALAQAGLVTSKKIKNWVYYKRSDEAIADFMDVLGLALGRPAA
jgi:ArsR family transcriptional regulator